MMADPQQPVLVMFRHLFSNVSSVSCIKRAFGTGLSFFFFLGVSCVDTLAPKDAALYLGLVSNQSSIRIQGGAISAVFHRRGRASNH
jgi:uncharacterized membrane protein